MGIANITNNILTDSGTTIAGLVPTSRTISTTAPLTGGGDLSANRTIAMPAATTTVDGYLTAVDWTTFNNKQSALTNPVTGTGTTNRIPKFTGASTLGNSIITEGTGFITVSGAAVDNYVASFINTDGGSAGIYVKADGPAFVCEPLSLVGGITLNSSGSASFSGDITANKYIKVGGTSSQFLMADGSVSTGPSGGITGSLTTNYVTKATGTNTIGNSLIFDNGTSVGIGLTTSLLGRLSVSSGNFAGIRIDTNATYSALSISGAGIVAVDAPSIVGGRFMILDNGNTTIGTNVDAGFKLDVNGTGRFSGALTGTSSSFSSTITSTNERGFRSSDAVNGGSSWLFGANTGRYFISVNGGVNALIIENTGAATFSSSVTATGLFIGTSNSQVGDINSTNANGGYLTWSTSGTVIADIGTAQQIFGSGGNAIFGINARGVRNLAFGTNNTERMRIASGGNVQITNPNTNTQLVIINTSSASTTNKNTLIQFQGSDTVGSIKDSGAIQVVPSGVNYIDASMLFYTRGSDSQNERMRITGGGNVYIGTTVGDGYKLQISGGSQANATFGQTYSGVAAYSQWVNSSGAFVMGLDGAAGATERMRITSAGNILIGTTSDGGYKLAISTGNQTALRIDTNANYNAINIGGNGNISVDYPSISGGRFYLDGGGALTIRQSMTATSFFESSDERLKTLKIDDVQVEGIEKLKAKLYIKDDKLEYGYFAQEAESYMPSAITVGKNGYLNLSYREVHTAKIARLEKRVEELEQLLNLN